MGEQFGAQYQLYHQVKLNNMNILHIQKYCHLIKEEYESKLNIYNSLKNKQKRLKNKEKNEKGYLKTESKKSFRHRSKINCSFFQKII